MYFNLDSCFSAKTLKKLHSLPHALNDFHMLSIRKSKLKSYIVFFGKPLELSVPMGNTQDMIYSAFWATLQTYCEMGISARRCTLILCAACLLLTPFCHSTLSQRNILSFWNWSLSFQVSSLPLLTVVLQNKIEECKFLLHLFYLLSYDMLSQWKGKHSF